MNISAELLDELIEHVREDPHNECCGVVAVEPTHRPPERRARCACIAPSTSTPAR